MVFVAVCAVLAR